MPAQLSAYARNVGAPGSGHRQHERGWAVADLEEGAAPTETVPAAQSPDPLIGPEPIRDPLRRFRYSPVGGGVATTEDCRVRWTTDTRDLTRRSMSGGERGARKRFWARLQDARYPRDPVSALVFALGLYLGPIPELQTQEQFAAYWTRERIETIAKRWLITPMTPNYAPAMMREARENLIAAAAEMTTSLVADAKNPDVPWTARIQAKGIVIREASASAPTTIQDLGLPPFIPENADLIRQALPTLAARIPDVARAKLIIDGIKEWLADNPAVPRATAAPARVVFEMTDSSPVSPEALTEAPPPPPDRDPSAGVLPDLSSPATGDEADEIEDFLDSIIPTSAEEVA